MFTPLSRLFFASFALLVCLLYRSSLSLTLTIFSFLFSSFLAYDDDKREHALITVRAGVYYFEGDEWKGVDDGLSLVQLYFNPAKETYRVVAISQIIKDKVQHPQNLRLFFLFYFISVLLFKPYLIIVCAITP